VILPDSASIICRN